MNTPENNKLIAIFDGQDSILGLDYQSWNKLMPVWFKILDLSEVNHIEIVKSQIEQNYVYLQVDVFVDGELVTQSFYTHIARIGDMLLVLYKTVVDFLLWYNNLIK